MFWVRVHQIPRTKVPRWPSSSDMARFLISMLHLSSDGNFVHSLADCPQIFVCPHTGYWAGPFPASFVRIRIVLGLAFSHTVLTQGKIGPHSKNSKENKRNWELKKNHFLYIYFFLLSHLFKKKNFLTWIFLLLKCLFGFFLIFNYLILYYYVSHMYANKANHLPH